MKRQLLLVLFFICNKYSCGLDNIKTGTSDVIQTVAINDLIKRTIPGHSNKFVANVNSSFVIGGREAFSLHSNSGIVEIVGTTGVVAATGFHYYLKYFCKCHVSWEGVQLNLPEILPEVNITITLNDKFRYYQNVCTTSYSFVWWTWDDWEKHIDWMALNSFNLVLAFTGQEAIWEKVYKHLNVTDEEIAEHFTGPAFLSWLRMGNIRGWGFSLSKSWNERSMNLQKKILMRMRNLGIIPILPAFAGHVPRAFARLYPNTKLIKMPSWNQFNDTYCCPYLIDPTDPLFKTVGDLFVGKLIEEFGTDHIYSCDTFNEMTPFTTNLTYLSSIGRAVLGAITETDPEGVWVMQNWLFVHDMLFWTNDRAKALLTSVPKGKLLVLDLQSEQFPQYTRLHQYFGHYYIWCMLHNFGGTLGMFGSSTIINEEPFSARNAPNSTMIGVGITPEGINQNYVIYDLMSETAWRKNPVNLSEWFKNYTIRRYGQIEPNAIKAWQILQETVYNFRGIERIRGQYAITRTPSLKINIWNWYNRRDLLEAWRLLLNSSDKLRGIPTFSHDLVDVTRQVLQVFGDYYYKKIIIAFKKKNLGEFRNAARVFLEIFDDLDEILETNRAFLLGRWLSAAKNISSDEKEKQQLEYNARNQISLWGPNGEIINYANKQWAGVVSHYFEPRWKLFLEYTNETLIDGTKFNQSYIKQKMFDEVEKPFTFDRTNFPEEPTGDTVEIAKRIYEKWWPRRKHTRFPRNTFGALLSLIFYPKLKEHELPQLLLV